MEFYSFLPYLQLHWLEILGTLTGLIYVFFSIQRKRVLWIFGGISSLFYIIVFFQAGLFAYTILYFYYTVISVYAWFAWAKHGRESKDAGVITRLKPGSWIITVSVISVLTLLLGLILTVTANSDIAWADALLTSGSIVATWLLMRKVIDHWLLWIGIDLLSGLVSFYKDLPFTAVLFFIYTLLAITGYSEWKKEMKRTLQP